MSLKLAITTAATKMISIGSVLHKFVVKCNNYSMFVPPVIVNVTELIEIFLFSRSLARIH